MLPLTEGDDGGHNLAGSKTAVALGERDREMPGRLARMRTAQAAVRTRIPLLRDSEPRRREGRARGRRCG